MSRTDSHVPLHVRVARGDVRRVEVHDHTNGVCDLADPSDTRVVPWRTVGNACHWTWAWDGHGVCPCELCHGGDANRRERRADRQRARRNLREAALRWTTGEDSATID